MPDDLDDDEKELLRQHREAKKAEQAKNDGELRVWIRSAAGEEADIPYGKGRSWLQQKFGIDLDDEPIQEPEGQAPPNDAQPPAGPVRFGRRVG